MTDQAPELLPCPFCGGTADFDRMGDARMSTIVRCDDCGCSLESGDTSNAGRSWNTRPPSERPVARVREAAQIVFDTFSRDEAQGYRSRDRQYAIRILGRALTAERLEAVRENLTAEEFAQILPHEEPGRETMTGVPGDDLGGDDGKLQTV